MSMVFKAINAWTGLKSDKKLIGKQLLIGRHSSWVGIATLRSSSSSIKRESLNFDHDTSANENPLNVRASPICAVEDNLDNISLVANSPAHLPANAQSLAVRSSTDTNPLLFSLASGPLDASADHISLAQDNHLLHGIDSSPQLTGKGFNETSPSDGTGGPIPWPVISEGLNEISLPDGMKCYPVHLPTVNSSSQVASLGLNEALPLDASPIVRSLSQLASTSANAIASLTTGFQRESPSDGTVLPPLSIRVDLGNNCLALSQSVSVTPCCSRPSSVPTDRLVDKNLTVASGSDSLAIGPVNHPVGMELDSGSSVPYTTIVRDDPPFHVSGPENSRLISMIATPKHLSVTESSGELPEPFGMPGIETVSSLLSIGIDLASDLTPAWTAATPNLPHGLAVDAMFDHPTTAVPRNTPVFSTQEVPSSSQQVNTPIPAVPLDLTTNDELTPPANETQTQESRVEGVDFGPEYICLGGDGEECTGLTPGQILGSAAYRRLKSRPVSSILFPCERRF